MDWSPDGARLAGRLVSTSGRTAGVAVYDLAARITTMLASDDTFAAKWLADSRRLVHLTKNGSALVVVDTTSRTRTVDVTLPRPFGERAVRDQPRQSDDLLRRGTH